MDTGLLDAARRLPVDERVDLVEAIWDSIAEEAGLLSLSAEHEVILDARLDEHLKEPALGERWDELRARLLSHG